MNTKPTRGESRLCSVTYSQLAEWTGLAVGSVRNAAHAGKFDKSCIEGEHQASQTRTTPHRYSRDDPLQGRTRNIAHNSPDSPRTPTNHFPQHPTPRDSREHYRATQERSPYFMQMYAMLLCTQEKTIDNHKPTLNQQQTNDNTTTNSRKIAPYAPCLGTPRSFRGTLTRRRAVALVLC